MANSSTLRDIKFKKDIKAALMCYYSLEALRRMGYDPNPIEEDYLKGILQEHLHIPGLDGIIAHDSFPGKVGDLQEYVNSYAHKQVMKALRPDHVLEYSVLSSFRWLPNLQHPSLEGYKIQRLGFYSFEKGRSNITVVLEEIASGSKMHFELVKPDKDSAVSPNTYDVAKGEYRSYFLPKAKVVLDVLKEAYGTEWTLYSPS